ncbi:MAG: DsbA family protein [Alphaproteobacteria bacterium GM202ARS2]|nr:DsbA family protein [Alphaproteobacteria bacterium GM202ARS2]
MSGNIRKFAVGLSLFTFLSGAFFVTAHGRAADSVDQLRQMMGIDKEHSVDDAVERAQKQRQRAKTGGQTPTKASVTELLDATDKIKAILPDLQGVDPRLLMPDQKEQMVKAMHEQGLLVLGGLSMGNPNGDIVIVEFADYNCGYCRIAHPNVVSLVEEDGNIHFIYRELPILGNASWAAARLALAADKQGIYEPMVNGLYGFKGRVGEKEALARAEALGANIETLKKDAQNPEINASIAVSLALSGRLGVRSTPTFIFGNNLISGAISLEDMKQIIYEIRREQQGAS